MATKKTASKKAATDSTPAPVKAAAKKTAAKKAPAKPAEPATAAAEHAPKARPSHHDLSVQAYLLWERDGKKHGHHEHYWHQAEQELNK